MKKSTKAILAVLSAACVSASAFSFAGCGECKHENLKATAEVAATCEAAGNSAYWYCSDCDKYFSDEACTTETTKDGTVIEKLGHSYSENFTVDTAATCEAAGSQSKHCTRTGCDSTSDVTPISATGHSYSTEWSKDSTYHWHAATCSHTDEISGKAEHSYTNGVCECGYKLTVTDEEWVAAFNSVTSFTCLHRGEYDLLYKLDTVNNVLSMNQTDNSGVNNAYVYTKEGENEVTYTSTDGGRTWTSGASGTYGYSTYSSSYLSPIKSFNSDFESFEYSDSVNGYVLKVESLDKTSVYGTDGGAFTSVIIKFENGNLISIYCLDNGKSTYTYTAINSTVVEVPTTS